MLAKGKARELMTDTPFIGESFTLNNDDAFIIPSIPVGPMAKPFLILQKKLGDANPYDPEGMDVWFDVTFQILQLNYPRLTEDDANGLTTIPQMLKMVSWFYTAGMEIDEDPTKAAAKPSGTNSPSTPSSDGGES